MLADYWYRQSTGKPLYDDLLWSRPENKLYAGKLLIVGGNSQGFARPAEAYGYSEKAGIGSARVLLPDVLQKTVGKVFPAADFAPSTPSGSFAQTALGELVPMAAWADGVLLAGDLGRNSETAIMLEKFAGKYPGALTITCDAADYFISTPAPLAARESSLMVISLSQLQKLAISLKFTTAFTLGMDLLRLVDALHEFTLAHNVHVITKHHDNILVAVHGMVSSTKLKQEVPLWRLQTASSAAVWWLQNSSRAFEALTTAVYTTMV